MLFVMLLAPGLAYVLRHERVVAAPPHSAFRETLRVVFVSVTCLTATGLLFVGLRAIWPERTPNIRGLVRDPDSFVRDHHVHLAWWALALLTFATLIGWIAGDPRVVRRVRFLRSTKWVRWLFDEGRISPASNWDQALSEIKDLDPNLAKMKTFVGAQLADGSYVRGYLVAFSPHTVENEHREL